MMVLAMIYATTLTAAFVAAKAKITHSTDVPRGRRAGKWDWEPIASIHIAVQHATRFPSGTKV